MSRLDWRAALRAGLLAVWGVALAAQPGWAAPERVVTLGGDVTEIVVALGATDRLIGRDTTSTYPPEIKSLPDLGYVRALSPEGVLSLGPDLVLAEASAGPPAAIEVLQGAGIPFLRLPGAPTPEGAVAKIRAVGVALGLSDRAEQLATRLQADLAQVEARSATIPKRRKVLFVLALQGGRVMAGGEGSSADGMIALAGGENVARGFSGYKPMSDEAILAAAPEVIVIMDRDGPMSISRAQILAQPALAATPAAQTGRIVAMDGMFLLGFGPRTAQAAQALQLALYPDLEPAQPDSAPAAQP